MLLCQELPILNKQLSWMAIVFFSKLVWMPKSERASIFGPNLLFIIGRSVNYFQWMMFIQVHQISGWTIECWINVGVWGKKEHFKMLNTLCTHFTNLHYFFKSNFRQIIKNIWAIMQPKIQLLSQKWQSHHKNVLLSHSNQLKITWLPDTADLLDLRLR